MPSSSPELREEFTAGARALGLVGRQKQLTPQQLLLADILNAEQRFTGVLLPRRSAKTTTLLAWLIGRCLSREDHLAAYAVMTSQKKARDRFLKDVVPILERVYPDADSRPFKIVRANGQERLVFTNGSILQFLGPNGDDFRSDSYDTIVLDEAGEADPEEGSDVLSAALPTQDTRPDAMMVMAGTAATYRKGNLLHDELEAGRAAERRHAILDYSTPDIEVDDLNAMSWDEVAPLVLDSHPGIGTLTTLEAVEDNFNRLPREKFGREYLGIFGTLGGEVAFLNLSAWNDGAITGTMPTPPARFALAVSVNLLGSSSGIMAVWRDDDGIAVGGVLAHAAGSSWLGPKARSLALKYKVALTYDSGVSTVLAAVEPLKRTNPKPKLDPKKWPDVAPAAAALRKEIDDGKVRHYVHDGLERAVQRTKRRGTPDAKFWAFAPMNRDEDDIVLVEAFALALQAYDRGKVRTPYRGTIET